MIRSGNFIRHRWVNGMGPQLVFTKYEFAESDYTLLFTLCRPGTPNGHLGKQ